VHYNQWSNTDADFRTRNKTSIINLRPARNEMIQNKILNSIILIAHKLNMKMSKHELGMSVFKFKYRDL
jgi:hypothetical protein